MGRVGLVVPAAYLACSAAVPEACPVGLVAASEGPAASEAVLTACRVAVPAACLEGLAAYPEGLVAASEVACPA